MLVADDGSSLAIANESERQRPGAGRIPDDRAHLHGSKSSGPQDRPVMGHPIDDSVTAIDLRTQQTTNIPVGSKPGAAAVDAARHTGYVVNRGDDTLSAIDIKMVAQTVVPVSRSAVGVDPVTHSSHGQRRRRVGDSHRRAPPMAASPRGGAR